MQATRLEREIQSRLSEYEIRFTQGRKAVVAALAASEGPRSAAEIHDTIDGRVPLSSLYRSLSVLEEAGVLEPHHGTKGITRYELAEWLTGHHHHLVCVDCGSVDDVHLSSAAEAELERLVSTITAEADFRGTGHALEIDGRCGRCS